MRGACLKSRKTRHDLNFVTPDNSMATEVNHSKFMKPDNSNDMSDTWKGSENTKASKCNYCPCWAFPN